MIAITEVFCDSSHRGTVGQAGREHLMTTQPIGPQSAQSSSHWYTTSATCNRSYLLAGLRAGVIALVLLVLLPGIVWFCSHAAGYSRIALVLAVRAVIEQG